MNELTAEQMADLRGLSARGDLRLEAAVGPLKAMANSVQWNLKAVGVSLQNAKRDSVQQFLGSLYSGTGNLDSGVVRTKTTTGSQMTLSEAMKRSVSSSVEFRQDRVQRTIRGFVRQAAARMMEELDMLDCPSDPVAKAVYPGFKHHFTSIIEVNLYVIICILTGISIQLLRTSNYL